MNSKTSKLKVYFTCAIKHAPPEYKQMIGRVVAYIKTIEFVQLLEFVNPITELSHQEVYKHDIHDCVKNADVVLGESSFPSFGQGYEFGTSVEKHGHPTVAFVSKTAQVSKFVFGIECDLNPLYKIVAYENETELLTLIEEFLQKEYKKRCQ